ncbi:MAG TPA: ATP-binding cassette domain-containing protein [Deinococcales bacterium]|nr:ATP-binding cassette domain-containing protein [Deinococcales bacterium]
MSLKQPPAKAVSSETVLRLEDVAKNYKTREGTVHALTGVNLSVGAGVIQGIIGFSGAGKSTLVRCLTALERPDRGTVSVDGVDLAGLRGRELRQARRRIGTIYQGFQLLNNSTALDNVALPLQLARVRRSATRRRALELLDWVGLSGRAGSYPAQLSGGQRQRVAIARALAARPDVLLCDEPTSALDTETTHSILNLIRRVRDEFRLTVLLITHELSAVQATCERVAVLDAGAIVEEGPTADVFRAPASTAGKRLLQVGS